MKPYGACIYKNLCLVNKIVAGITAPELPAMMPELLLN